MSSAPQEDIRGNQYATQLSEWEKDIVTCALDSTGYHNGPLLFALKEGENVLTITALKGKLSIKSLRLYTPKSVPTYEEARASWPKTVASKPLHIEAEFTYLRNDTSIVEVCDRTSPSTSPAFQGIQKWNAVGGSGWGQVGQRLTWKVNVKESGRYTLLFRFRQNYASGLVSYRRLLINGELPFAEAASLVFPYNIGWQYMQPSDANGLPYEIYLPAGEHTLTLEVNLGNLSDSMNIAQKSLYELNTIYRKILKLTGSNPDTYRDYQVEKKLPDVLTTMTEQTKVLQTLSDWLYMHSGSKGEETAVVDKLIWQLGEFLKYPETIPSSLTNFQNNITSFGSWLQRRTAQPLALDYIELVPAGTVPEKTKDSFLQKITFGAKLFLRSFTKDYGVIGNIYDNEEALGVWLMLGRDQYQILKEHIDNTFVPKFDIRVNLKLVSGGILEAIVAGTAPDVYLFAGVGDPVNFASRKALVNLSSFENFEQVAARFEPQALVPFTYDNAIYGLPISHSFLMMFTRDDLLAEIGLTAPKTWDDVYKMLPILHQNNMEFAFPAPSSGDLSSYALLLFQEQQEFYRDGGKKVAIDTEEAIRAFEKWTKLYSKYSSSMSYSFVNRFRSGDMPIGIVDFGNFNTLQLSAPEIKGLWNMHPVPGTRMENNQVRNISVGGGTAAIIISGTKLPKESWEFIKWFTDEEEQYAYATAIENRLGPSARFATANRAAFRRLAWTSETLKALEFQRASALGIQQVPGGYFLSRHIDNIFRIVVNKNANVRDTVLEYTNIINKELTRKRREFGLEVAE